MKHSLLLAPALLVAASLRADPATTNRWIGGDQSASAASNPFAEADNWALGAALAVNYGSADELLLIDTDGDIAPWVSSSSGYYINSPITIGSTDDPTVTVTFSSTRGIPASGEPNDDPAAIPFARPFTILGANTTVRVNRGLALGFNHNGTGADCFAIDPAASLVGEGILRFSGDLSAIPARDYDALELSVGNSNASLTRSLAGDASTSGRAIVSQNGSGGVNGLATLDLAGHDLSVGSLLLGLLDNRPEEGDQSGFGRVLLNGGTLSVTGDIVCRSNPDGVTTAGAALTQDSSIAGGTAGGTVRLAGSIAGFATKTPSAWTVENVDLVLCGDGSSVQEFEAMSGNFGDTTTAAIGNYFWKSLSVESGASARLVDTYDNHRTSTGAETVYVGDLVVESGATLDLNGIALYYTGTATLDGTVTGGTPVRLSNAAAMKHYAFPLGTPDTADGLGYWIGDIAAGDFNGDGHTEILTATVDEKSSDEDCHFYALRFANGALSNVANFPILDYHLDVNRNKYTFWFNFCVGNLGDGSGPALFYDGDGYMRPSAIGASATPRYLTENANVHYGKTATLHIDLDNDGILETITGGRATTGNVRVYESRGGTPALRWSATVPSGNGIVVQLGAADLDGDRSPEIFAIGNTGHLAAFHADGTTYIADIDLAISPGENFGDLAAADITGDGVPEFIYAHAGQALNVWNQAGLLLFTSSIGWLPNGFALADFNKDGVYEIVYGDRILKGDGTTYATIPLPAGTSLHTTAKPILADFTGDQIPEIVYFGSTISNTRVGTVVSVYDVTAGETLAGFPVSLTLGESVYIEARRQWVHWWAGNLQHWNGYHSIVADLDDDGRWDIAVPTGANNVIVTESPYLNIISTPYVVAPVGGRTAADIGWTSFRHDAACSSAFPLAKNTGTVVFLR